MSNEHLKLVASPRSGAIDTLIGQVLDGRYEIEKVLGEGGMGIVYKARHVTLGKPLAIKVLKADVSKDGEIVQRFRQEAQSATAIGNHHIIDISDFGALSDGSTYFVMEFLDGIALTKAIEPNKPLKVSRTIHIAKQLCRALGAAHEVGIVHRDLKPDNIYLISRGGDRDFVKVLDFGIAKVGGQKSKLTQVGQVFGTPHYMSPEQCAGAAVDKRTDIYALGVIMYEMTSSRVPFDADNLMGILTKHLYEEPVKPHQLPPPVDVPPALEAVIMKCLAKKPDVRYQTMQELLADLELVEQGLTPNAVVEGLRRASQNTGRNEQPPRDNSTGLSVDVGSFELPKSSGPGLFIGAALIVLLLGGGALYAFRNEPDETSAGVEPEPSTMPAATLPPAQPVPAPTAPASPPSPPSRAATPSAPQEPPPAPTKSDEVPAIPSVTVQIASAPTPAEVYRDGVLVGSTPWELVRPRPDEPAIELELRAEGYRAAPLRVTSQTHTRLSVALARERKRAAPAPTQARPAPSAPAASPATPAEVAPVEEPKRPRVRPSTEVLDPWN